MLDTLVIGEIEDETFEPPAGQPGNLLKLSARADVSARYVKAEDLQQLSEGTLNASMPGGFAPVDGSMQLHLTADPAIDDAGAAHFELNIERKLVRRLDLSRECPRYAANRRRLPHEPSRTGWNWQVRPLSSLHLSGGPGCPWCLSGSL